MIAVTNKLKALTFVCSLKPLPEESSTEKLAQDLQKELEQYNVENEFIRAVDYDIKPGVKTDMGGGDEWPPLRQKMLDADIIIMATPTWVGQASSITQRIIERLDAELSETDDQGRLLTYGKTAAVVVVGNEDGAHKIVADLFQCLNDVGFTIPAAGSTYWNGEAMNKKDYKDLANTPDMVRQTNRSLAANLAHVTLQLKQTPYPPSR